jgi:iron complex outermembrane receptor protein
MVPWLNINAGYSKLEATLKKGGNVPYIPSDKLTGEIKLIRKQLWKFNNSYFSIKASNYQKRNDVAEYELSSDAYTLLDVSIGGSFKIFKQEADLSIFCTNLTNEAYFNQLSLVKYIGVRDMGRNIGFNLHMPFGL